MTLQLGPPLGILEPFYSADFTGYYKCLNSYFGANNVGQVADDATEEAQRAADRKKVTVTISLVGKKTYSTLKRSLSSKFTC